jgi:CRISPR system Cascade subunit CasB
MTESVERESRNGGLREVIRSITTLLKTGALLTTGDVAQLRRMDPRQPAAAFFKLAGVVLDDLPGDARSLEERETRWAAIICGLANLGDLHRPDDRLGDVLAEAGYSDFRFVRLVRADSDHLVDELPSLSRYLAAKGVSVDWTDAARLMLSAGGPNEEAVRRAIARDFYRVLARVESATS